MLRLLVNDEKRNFLLLVMRKQASIDHEPWLEVVTVINLKEETSWKPSLS